MHLINISKYAVKANFPGYYYPLFSLVIVREDDKDILARIIGYDGNNGVIVHAKSGKKYKLKYHEVVFYEDPHEPIMTLKEIERYAYKYVNKYSKESITILDKDYIIHDDVRIVFDTESGAAGQPTALGSVCLRYTNPFYYEFRLSVPFLQYANKKQIKEIILHETAHIIAGEGVDYGNHHGPTWRDIYLAMGGNGKATVEIKDAAYLGLYFTELPSDWEESTHYDIPRSKWTEFTKFINRNINIGKLCLDLDVGDKLLSDNGYDSGNIAKKVDALQYSVVSYSLVDDHKVAVSMVKWSFTLFYKLILELRDRLKDVSGYGKEKLLVEQLYSMLKTDFSVLTGA